MILFVIDEECVNKRVVHHSHTPDSLICSYQMYFWICISLLVDVMKRAASSEQHAASSEQHAACPYRTLSATLKKQPAGSAHISTNTV